MWGIFKRKTGVNIYKEQVDDMLIASFNRVRQDTSNLFHWVDYLYKQNLNLQHSLNELQNKVETKPSKEQIIQIVDEYSGDSFERLKLIEKRIEKLTNLQDQESKPDFEHTAHIHQAINPVIEKLNEISHRLNLHQKGEAKGSFTNLKEKIIKSITRNSKDYVKNIILGYIQKYDKISGLQLREMVVDEQKLTSKSTFYRLLTELEKDNSVEVASVGKEKVYFSRGIEQSKHI